MTEKYLSRQIPSTQERYFSLSEDHRREVDVQFQRHCRASAKCNLGPDPSWLVEVLGEINADRVDFACEVFDLEIF